MVTFAIALIAGVLIAAGVFTAIYVGLHLYVYYLVDGIGKVLEVIEQPYIEESRGNAHE